MNHLLIKKKLAAIGSSIGLALAILICPATSLPTQAASHDSEIMPLKARIEWVFKVENNKLYRRLYNYSIGAWIGDWEYVGDV